MAGSLTAAWRARAQQRTTGAKALVVSGASAASVLAAWDGLHAICSDICWKVVISVQWGA